MGIIVTVGHFIQTIVTVVMVQIRQRAVVLFG